jgi:hypothetical protein
MHADPEAYHETFRNPLRVTLGSGGVPTAAGQLIVVQKPRWRIIRRSLS